MDLKRKTYRLNWALEDQDLKKVIINRCLDGHILVTRSKLVRSVLLFDYGNTADEQVEVTPSSFQKIKLLGKGDVGKVYLVREKKTDKLFAMKGGQ